MTDFAVACDEYLNERTGRYEYRQVRYLAACHALFEGGITDNDTLLDLGAGWTEFDFCIRTQLSWRGRYIPIDGAIDNTDIERWNPPRDYEWVVALEILEHLHNPGATMSKLQRATTRGIVVSVPNPDTTDVLGMDRTHVSIITRKFLEAWGFTVTEATFYGGVFSGGKPDCLFGVWYK